MECKNCNKNFEGSKNRKFCSRSCSASFNNKGLARNKKIIERFENCIYCNIKITGGGKKYCSMKCSNRHKIENNYKYYLNNQEEYSNKLYNTSYIKPHILNEQNNFCNICGCNNIHNGKLLVFILDHIDGNARNNKRENLRCICPNCDSQLDTYKSKNKNSARSNRYK